jgi:hypothetical protein
MCTVMRRFCPLFLLASAILLTAAAHPAPAGPGTALDDDARRAAQSWLALMDGGQYAESWQEAGRLFQRSVTADAWARQAAGIRQRTGSSIARELVTDTEVTDPPGVPPGEYFRIRYETECASAGVVRETVLLQKESGRGWRVVSYVVA